jgi:L-arabinokinase
VPQLLFYVSGHGFGHATRVRALIAELLERTAGALDVHVRTNAPEWIFLERDAGVACSEAPIDIGVLQRGGMDVDLPASLAAHEAFVAEWEASVEREAAFIAELAPTLVVADIPPLAFAAAARAGVPAVGVANFSWDWIAAEYAERDSRWQALARHYRAAYASAQRLYRLPLHADLSAFADVVDVPFLVNRSPRSRAECRARLGIPAEDTRRLVLVSFGGFVVEGIDSAGGEGASDTLFAVVGDPPPGAAANWIALPRPSPLPQEDLMHAADAVLGKTGYGTVAEALAHETRFLYLPRSDFPEVAILEAGVERLGCARPMPRPDFESGRWRSHLDALFAQPPPPAPPDTSGAAVIADAILERISPV